jgi:hypothetical protein
VPFSPDGTYNGGNHAFVMKIGNDTPVEIGSDGNGNDMLEFYVLVTIFRGSPDRMSASLIGTIVVNNRTREAV